MRWRWHTLLFAVYPVLFLYARNSGNLPGEVLTRPLVVALAFGLLVWLLSWRAARGAERGALLATAVLVLWYAYGHVHALLAPSVFGQHRVLLPLWLAVVVWLGAVMRRGRVREDVTRNLSLTAILVGLVLVAFPVARLMRDDSPPSHEFGHSLEVEFDPELTPGEIHPDADIYHVILDGYGRADILRDLYGYDNEPFLDALRERGFCVVDSARANFTQTLLSLVKTMGGPVPMPGGFRYDRDSRDRRPLARQLYRSVHGNPLTWGRDWQRTFATGYAATEVLDVDRFHSPPLALNEFERALAASTPLGVLLNLVEARFGDVLHRQLVAHAFDRLPVAPDYPPRAYTFAHIIAPHPPFVFAPPGATAGAMVPLADGDHVVGGDGLTVAQYRAAYRLQVAEVNLRMVKAIDAILANGRESVILLHGDHGPGSLLKWEDRIPDPVAARERLGILLAVRLPDSHYDLCERANTPTGLLRELVTRMDGVRPAAYQEHSFFSTWSRPYDFVEIAPDGRVVSP